MAVSPARALGQRSTSPAPLVLLPSGEFEGNDGAWSTFDVRVGTPPQNFRVMISTAASAVWVPTLQDCNATHPECGSLRGVGLFVDHGESNGFQSNGSSTWVSEGHANLTLEENLGYSGTAAYGYDTVGLGTNGSTSLSSQIVADMTSQDYYFGIFGINASSSTSDSFLRNLKDQSLIPSLSYGYTAGAPYKAANVSGSLVLGGQDESRYTPSGFEYPFHSESYGSFAIGVQSVLGQNTLAGSASFYTEGYWATIDSTVPEVWLPRSACDLMEEVLDLTYDNTTDLYLVNSTTRAKLQRLNPTVTFKIGPWIYGGNTTEISLPYAAFDQQIGQPKYSNSTYYFPIRRAADNSQLVLGRTFLQGAYLIADFERKTFTVNAANFSDPMPDESIVTITSTSTSSSASSTSKPIRNSSIAPAAIAGIGVGAAALVISVLVLFIFLRKRSKRRSRAAAMPPKRELTAAELAYDDSAYYEAPAEPLRCELVAEESNYELHTDFVSGGKIVHRADGNEGNFVHELPADGTYTPDGPQKKRWRWGK